jgi:hypothetical protein
MERVIGFEPTTLCLASTRTLLLLFTAEYPRTVESPLRQWFRSTSYRQKPSESCVFAVSRLYRVYVIFGTDSVVGSVDRKWNPGKVVNVGKVPPRVYGSLS